MALTQAVRGPAATTRRPRIEAFTALFSGLLIDDTVPLCVPLLSGAALSSVRSVDVKKHRVIAKKALRGRKSRKSADTAQLATCLQGLRKAVDHIANAQDGWVFGIKAADIRGRNHKGSLDRCQWAHNEACRDTTRDCNWSRIACWSFGRTLSDDVR